MDRVLFASSLYMAFWVFIMPGSVYVGSWQSHDAFLQAVWEAALVAHVVPFLLYDLGSRLPYKVTKKGALYDKLA